MRATLLNQAISAAATIAPGPLTMQLNDAPRSLQVQANFTYGSGGTSVDAYLQTSFDGGTTWCDIAQFHFTTASARLIYNLSSATPKTTQVTPTDGALTGNTSVDGLIGPQFQVKLASVGTYAATNLRIDVVAQEK